MVLYPPGAGSGGGRHGFTVKTACGLLNLHRQATGPPAEGFPQVHFGEGQVLLVGELHRAGHRQDDFRAERRLRAELEAVARPGQRHRFAPLINLSFRKRR